MIVQYPALLDYIAKMNKKKFYPLLIIVLLAAIFLLQRFGPASKNEETYRDAAHLIYTKHARCRMGCRNIDENEVKEVIDKGKLNEAKSGMSKKNDMTYALEGWSSDHQHVRVVVTPEDDGLLVITVIDLENEWPCHCDES